MPQSHLAYLPSLQTGRGASLIDSTELSKFFNMVLGCKSGIVAHAGGGQSAATPLSLGFNEVDTCATAADSVQLPPAILNAWCWVYNGGAASLSIYSLGSNWQNGSVTDVTIPHGVVPPNAGTAAVTLAVGHTSLFVCMMLGVWKQFADFA
jgi:hypothetical protein